MALLSKDWYISNSTQDQLWDCNAIIHPISTKPNQGVQHQCLTKLPLCAITACSIWPQYRDPRQEGTRLLVNKLKHPYLHFYPKSEPICLNLLIKVKIHRCQALSQSWPVSPALTGNISFSSTDTGYRSIPGPYNKLYMKFSVNHRREAKPTTEASHFFHSH